MGKPGELDQLAQEMAGFGAGIDDAAAGIEQRALGVPHRLDRGLDALEVALELRPIALVLEVLRPGIDALGELDILRDVDDNRARPAALGDVECLVQHARQVGDALHQIIVLGTGPGDADRVAFLEGIVADEMGRHLPGDDDERDRVAQGVGQPGDGIGRARARGHQHAADLAGRARIALGGVHGALLVPHQDVLELLLLKQRVVDRQDRPAGIAEQVRDPLVDEGLDHHLCAGHFLAHRQLHALSPIAAHRELKRAARALSAHRHVHGWPSHPRRCASVQLPVSQQ